MTIPSEIILPEPPQDLDENLKRYLYDYTYKLQEMYENLARISNGTYLYENDDATQDIYQGAWRPEVFAVATPGAGTYDHQIGYTVRKGIVVNAFFDVQWSAHTGSGNFYVELPYKVRKASNMPFVGVAQTSNFTLGAIDYAVFNAIPDTYRLELWSVTTAAATANIALDTAARVIGSITYIGQEDEGD